jgi:hypothetical protein
VLICNDETHPQHEALLAPGSGHVHRGPATDELQEDDAEAEDVALRKQGNACWCYVGNIQEKVDRHTLFVNFWCPKNLSGMYLNLHDLHRKNFAKNDLICYTAVKVEPMRSTIASHGNANQKDRELTGLSLLARIFRVQAKFVLGLFDQDRRQSDFFDNATTILIGMTLRHLEELWQSPKLGWWSTACACFASTAYQTKDSQDPSLESQYF